METNGMITCDLDTLCKLLDACEKICKKYGQWCGAEFKISKGKIVYNLKRIQEVTDWVCDHPDTFIDGLYSSYKEAREALNKENAPVAAEA